MRWPKSNICAFVLVALALPASGQTRDPIQLATQNLPPYHMLVDGQIKGVAFDRVTCALDRMGRPYEIIMMDWSQAQLQTENGDVEGFFAGSPNKARAVYATPSDPVITEDLAWFMLPGRDIDPTDEADKVSARFSAKFATSKWLKLKRDGYNVIKKPRDAEALLNMLRKGEIDVALEYELIFQHYMRAADMKGDDLIKIPSKSQSNMVHFSNRFLAANPLFLGRFNSFLAMCKAGEK